MVTGAPTRPSSHCLERVFYRMLPTLPQTSPPATARHAPATRDGPEGRAAQTPSQRASSTPPVEPRREHCAQSVDRVVDSRPDRLPARQRPARALCTGCGTRRRVTSWSRFHDLDSPRTPADSRDLTARPVCPQVSCQATAPPGGRPAGLLEPSPRARLPPTLVVTRVGHVIASWPSVSRLVIRCATGGNATETQRAYLARQPTLRGRTEAVPRPTRR